MAFANSRFTTDARFPRDRVDALCDEWLVRARKRGEVFGAEVDDVLAGLVTCEREGDAARVGVLAVEPSYRGVGIGSGLLNAASDRARRDGLQKVRVVTQGGNVEALTVYESVGFRTTAVGIWHHKWFQ
jgi:GNAT superfamily N-acetyltransferase